ncbi:MAG: PilZ domain-containing protein, partial [Spirochaetaceae bacterium]|nr:PilZ domain-containing protein [Spirochaetaceae bacterium]
TGIYVATDREVGLGTCLALDIAFPNGEKASVPGEVVWIHGGSDKNPPGFGCRFTCAGKHFKTEIARAIRGLHAAMRDR